MFFRPQHVHYVLVEHVRNFSKHTFATSLHDLLGDGLLTTDGDFHHQQRRLVQPVFFKQRMERYGTIMAAYTQDLLERWRPGMQIDMAQAMQSLALRIIVRELFAIDLEAPCADLGQALFEAMQELTLRIVAQALFDTDLKAQGAGRGHILAQAVRELTLRAVAQALFAVSLKDESAGPCVGEAGMSLMPRLSRLRRWGSDALATPYARRMAAVGKLDTHIYELIARRHGEDRDAGDVLSPLLQAQDEGITMTDRQVRDQLMTFFAAGHQTTANAVTWTFYLLARHPAVYERLLAELRARLAGRTPTVHDLAALPYLDWVVSESARMYPPAWVLGRNARADFELEGYHFPAGTMVMLSQWVTHRLPEIWGDPEVYRPDRWDPAHGHAVPQGAYFPFGMGPHACMGIPFAQAETRLLLATILQRYTPRLVPGYPVVLHPLVTLSPKYGIRMTLELTSKRAGLPPSRD
jgi:cytochrome P450